MAQSSKAQPVVDWDAEPDPPYQTISQMRFARNTHQRFDRTINKALRDSVNDVHYLVNCAWFLQVHQIEEQTRILADQQPRSFQGDDNDQSDRTVKYTVRLPRTLWLTGHRNGLDPQAFFFVLGNRRKQLGYHCFVTGDENEVDPRVNLFKTIGTAWVRRPRGPKVTKGMTYRPMCNVTPTNAHYPFYRTVGQHKTELQLVLGRCFNQDYQGGSPRTEYRECNFWRYYSRNRNPYISEVTEDFFDSDESFIEHYTKFQDEDVFALYVCNGARLLVLDDLTYEIDKKDPMKLAKVPRKFNGGPHTRSIFQQGSLVIVRGAKLRLEILVKTDMTNTRYEFYHREWSEQNNDLLPDLPEKGLNELNRKVIFLGATESQFNTVCWALKIETNADDVLNPRGTLDYTLCKLVLPEKGRIVDIASWEKGFELIKWRHRYERLFESVVVPIAQPSCKNTMHFAVPNEDIMNRIHDMCLNSGCNEVLVQIPDLFLYPGSPDWSDDDRDIARYVDYQQNIWTGIDANHWFTERVSPPPLYPPVWTQNGMQYWLHGSQQIRKVANHNLRFVVKTCGFVEIINLYEVLGFDNKFRLECNQKAVYDWVRKYGEPENFGVYTLDDRYRLANDLLYYQKGHQIGTAFMFYLVED